MTKEMLEMNQVECDKCCGTGLVYGPDVSVLIRRERYQLGEPRKLIAALAKIPYESYCKFETGTLKFSEGRVRKIIEIIKELKNESNA